MILCTYIPGVCVPKYKRNRNSSNNKLCLGYNIINYIWEVLKKKTTKIY